VFDQYRIVFVDLWSQPRQSVSYGVGVNPGVMTSVVDYDDANALTSVIDAFDYENCLVGSMLTGHHRAFVPHSAKAVFSGTFTSYGNESMQWIDAASQTVQHYGVKFSVNATDIIYSQDVFARVHLQFRNVR